MGNVTSQKFLNDSNYLGLGLAIAIISLWILSGTFAVLIPLRELPWWGITGGILARTFLHTGLFILAHDAMHGNLVPTQPSLNQKLGQLAVKLYAGLSYENCRLNHLQHHQTPAQTGDPDFHDGVHRHPVFWYFHFLGGYFSWGQFAKFLGAIACFSLTSHTLFTATYLSLFLFFLLPLLLSSFQLFLFGTYLPHGKNITYVNHPASLHFLWLIWSLLSCYHFGSYHKEHHAHPHKAWFKLPTSMVS